MRSMITVCVLVVSCLACQIVGAAKPGSGRPNIVLIMADDLGFSDLGCYGSEIETPHLDQLASEGLRFNQFYNTAKCHSSRICLLTGLYMFQAGNTKMDKGLTIAEALGASGYHTMMAGKWHLQDQPTDRGFDRYFGHLSGATNFFTGDDSFRLNGQPYTVPAEGFYTTDANTDHAIAFLDEAAPSDKPFFLYMAYNAPHYPLHVKEPDYRKYEGRYDAGWDQIRKTRHEKQIELGILPETTDLSSAPTRSHPWDDLNQQDQKWESERMAAYAGMVDSLDQNIGRLIQHLKDQNVLDNTLIMFCSDNGACPFERTKGKELRPWNPKSYWTYDTGWAHVGNTPFRWYKQNQHEGGISSPLIVSWPKLETTPGSVTDQPAHLIDIMATCLDVSTAKYPKKFADRNVTPLQGRSMAPIFAGKTRTPHDWLYFQFSNNRAIRIGDKKLASVKGGPWELYDLSTDRSELLNLAKDNVATVQKMKSQWHQVASEVEQAPSNLRKEIGAKPKAQKRKNLSVVSVF